MPSFAFVARWLDVRVHFGLNLHCTSSAALFGAAQPYTTVARCGCALPLLTVRRCGPRWIRTARACSRRFRPSPPHGSGQPPFPSVSRFRFQFAAFPGIPAFTGCGAIAGVSVCPPLTAVRRSFPCPDSRCARLGAALCRRTVARSEFCPFSSRWLAGAPRLC